MRDGVTAATALCHRSCPA